MKPTKRPTYAREWLLQDMAALSAQLDVLKHTAADVKTLKVAAGLEAPSAKVHEKKAARLETQAKAEPKPVYLQQTMDQTVVAAASELPLKRKRLKSSLFDASKSDFVTEPIERETKRNRKKAKKSDYRQTQLNFKAASKK